MQYLISKQEKKISQIPSEYKFQTEDEIQQILANNPEIVLNIDVLEIEKKEGAVSCREFSTSSGKIDVLYLTPAGEIVIVETKLIRNPEASRTVVAQTIDYVKSLSAMRADEFISRLNQLSAFDSKKEIGENVKIQIARNLKSGYFKVIILGDFINPQCSWHCRIHPGRAASGFLHFYG